MVLKTALEGTGELRGYLRGNGGGRNGDPVNFWEILRDCVEKSKAKKFDWKDEDAVRHYTQSYEACKEQYVAQSRYIVTTTGNVRCSEIKDFWARDLHDTECKGIVIFLDEGCKDLEMDTLSAMLSKEHIKKIWGIIMLGDEKYV